MSKPNIKLAGGLTLLALAVSQAVHAQEAAATQAEGVRQLDTVVVTGTNIRGAEPAGNVVQVIGAEQIKASGKATVADFLRELPANFAGGVGMADNVQGGQDASTGGANLTGGQGVNLRGLGALSTLVLVDGRRVAAAGQFGDFVDISNIPLAAIDRIEVLADGASAVYGSDAVGGVVNIILKRDAEGFDTSVRLGTTTQGGGQQLQVSQTWGGSWDGGHAFAGVEFNRQNSVSASDRDIYNGGDFSDRGGVNWPRYTARAGSAANLFSATASGAGNVVYSVPAGAGTGLTAADLVPVSDGVGNTYDPWNNIDILPQMKRHSVFGTFDQALGEAATLYGDLRYTKRKGEYDQGYAVLYGTLPATSPYYIPGVANNFGVVIDDRGLRREVEVESWAANLGVRFDFSDDWHGDAALSYSREEQQRRSQLLRDGSIYDRIGTAFAPSSVACSLLGTAATAAGAYCDALGYEAFNPYSTDPLSAQVLDQLIGYEDVTFRSWLAQATFKVDGKLAELPGGALRVAAGLDWRRENIGGELDFNWRSIDPVHVAYGTTERDVAAGYVEAAIPLIGKDNARSFAKALDLSLALRHERISGLGDYSTTNPKVGVSFKPTDDLTLRGSWGTSFHAPPMRYMYDGVQPVTGGNAAFMRADLYTAPCSTTMVPLNGVVGTPGGSGNCSFTAILVTGGAGDSLKPEEAKTWTAGFDYTPGWAPGLKLGAGYFNIKIDDRIVRIQGGTLPAILAQYFATGSTPYASNLSANPSAAEVQAMLSDPRYLGQLGAGAVQSADDVAMIVYATQMNLASLKMDGMDFDASYGLDVGAGGYLDLFLRGTQLFSYKVQSTPGGSWVDQLGKYSSTGNPVRLRSQQGLSWNQGAFRGTLTANYVHDYQCSSGCYVPGASGAPALATAPVKISSWTTWDLQLDYDLSRFGGLFEDMRVSLYANNLFDRDPPFIDGGTATTDALADPYDAANATVLGRTLALTINKHW
ncbi:TonB-dependent receptor [Stenotrophomonas sp. MMGLT7]|uniref:TonB-dependent receptor domain-containing protein n=1 Tax=Stenotrophomonas sp. MMGLT7 TaxID=2901227 RepID=UPI001E4D66CB|nr:TonB-dependent receptor [Stenotrophomonas sp. MMGLT7]MCD7100043.1 TonB-dependent receptor [Stenotrophomonas sp. MMGLT7]